MRSQSPYEEASYNITRLSTAEETTETGIRIDVTNLRLDIGRSHDKSFRRPALWIGGGHFTNLLGNLMTFRLLPLTIALTLVAGGSMSFSSRAALGIVLKTCEVSYELSGGAFPCLKVVEGKVPLSSYAVLREPTAGERTIFTPLSALSGIEDPRLLDPATPNYFAMAWQERSLGIPATRQAWDDAALAINAAIFRTQDHLHIHIGCVKPRVKNALARSTISAVRFERLKLKLEGQLYWALFVPGDGLASVNPVQVVASEIPGAARNMKGVTIGVIGGEHPDGTGGIYILANVMTSLPRHPAAAEDLVDPKCS